MNEPMVVDTTGWNEHAKKYFFLDNKHFIPKEDTIGHTSPNKGKNHE